MKIFDEKGRLAVCVPDRVVGPASAVNERIVVFDGNTGKLIKDGGVLIADLIAKSIGTTKGDIIVFTGNGTPIRLGVGSNNQVLIADSSEASGVKWATLSGGEGNVTGADSSVDKDIVIFDGTSGKEIKDSGKKIADLIEKSIGTQKGDIIVFTANGQPIRLGVGTDNQVLTADSSEASGVKWATPSGGGGSGYPRFKYQSGSFDIPNNSDWKVNAYPGLVADANNNALSVHPFDDTTEEGVGFQFRVPSGASNIIIKLISRAKTAPSSAKGVALKLYFRKIGDDEEIGTWSSGYELNKIDIPTNTYFQYDEQTIALSTLSLTAGYYQFELTRNPSSANDDLVGDWNLLEVEISFS